MVRRSSGARRAAKIIDQQAVIDAYQADRFDWAKYTRCSLCRRRCQINNYADRKVRVSQNKVGKLFVCPWCKPREGVNIAKQLIGQALMLNASSHTPGKRCSCVECQSRRLLHTNFPTVAKLYNVAEGPKPKKVK
jgi:hypothetical protein